LINADNVEYYRQRARGQIGLILTEGTLISPQGTEWGNAPGIWNQEQVEAWRPLIQAVHDQGCQIVCQLWHLGRQNRPDMPMQVESGEPVWAPSAVSARGGKVSYTCACLWLKSRRFADTRVRLSS
jgi:2,4-dienoyl-CoA reductase-like NADH-dependent reductase (Old Yellow Enzyme family)